VTAVWAGPDIPDPDVTGQPARASRVTRPIGALRHGLPVVDGERRGVVRRAWAGHWHWVVEWPGGARARISVEGRMQIADRMLLEVISG